MEGVSSSSLTEPQVQAAQPTRGYPCDVLDNTSGPMETICSVCFSLLREPRLVTCCKKSFCRTCIEKPTGAYKDYCPQCGAPDFTVVPDLRLESALRNVRVCCRYPRGQDEVCEWVGPLSEFDHHLRHDCKFVEIPCLNCNVQFQRRHIYNHFAACPKRQSTCEFCGFKATYDVVVRHREDECRRVTVRCPRNCEDRPIERQDLAEHEKICPCAEVDCEYAGYGCAFRPLRKDLQTHLKENVGEHVALVSALCEENSKKINDLRQENSGIGLTLQELQIASLEKKQERHQERLERTEGMLRGVDYNVKCVLPQQIMKLQNQCDKLRQTQEEVQNSADYQMNKQQIANQKLKEELTRAIEEQQREMAALQQKQEESTAAQQQRVLVELKQEIEQTNQVMEEKLVKLSEEDKMLMARNKEELSTAIAQGDQAVKDELTTTITEGDQAVKDELTAKLTSENLALKVRMDALSQENRELKHELQVLNTKFDRKIEELTRDLVQTKQSFQQKWQNMQETQDQKVNRLQNEHHQDLSLLRSSMVSCVKIPCDQRMTNFADRKSSNSPWYSEPFTVGYYKFGLVVYANGSGPHTGTHVSIYAHLMEGSFSEAADQLQVEGEIVVLLVNQLGRHGNKSVHVPLSREPPSLQRKTPGTDLVSHEALNHCTERVAFLHNDQMHLRIVEFKAAPTKRGGGWFNWS